MQEQGSGTCAGVISVTDKELHAQRGLREELGLTEGRAYISGPVIASSWLVWACTTESYGSRSKFHVSISEYIRAEMRTESPWPGDVPFPVKMVLLCPCRKAYVLIRCQDLGETSQPLRSTDPLLRFKQFETNDDALKRFPATGAEW